MKKISKLLYFSIFFGFPHFLNYNLKKIKNKLAKRKSNKNYARLDFANTDKMLNIRNEKSTQRAFRQKTSASPHSFHV